MTAAKSIERRTASRGHNDADEGNKTPRQADIITKIALQKASLWTDTDGTPYASVPVGSHTENYRLRSNSFRSWLGHQFYTAEKQRAASAKAMEDALRSISGHATFGDTPTYDVHVRVAGHRDKIYVDMCDPLWRAIEIDADGWRICKSPPVKFRRGESMRALPDPMPDGRLDDFRRLRPLSDEQWALIAGWIVNVARPNGGYAIMYLTGEQDSGKSWLSKWMRQVFDPNRALMAGKPKDERDLAIQANNGRVVGLENISTIEGRLSDALCCCATGAAFRTRTLFANEDETVLTYRRPIIINSIGGAISEADLFSRTIQIHLDPIATIGVRKTDVELAELFTDAWASILGGACTAVSEAILRQGKVGRSSRRMADHDLWARGAEPAMGIPEGTYALAVSQNQAQLTDEAIDASPVATAIVAMKKPWRGTTAELAKRITPDPRPPDWPPRTNRSLGAAVKRAMPLVRQRGVEIRRLPGRTSAGLLYTITDRNDKIAAAAGRGEHAETTAPLTPKHTGTPSEPTTEAAEHTEQDGEHCQVQPGAAATPPRQPESPDRAAQCLSAENATGSLFSPPPEGRRV